LSTRRLIVLGTITFVAGLITLFPARVAYDLFAPPALRLSGVDGTLWAGSANEGELSGLYLRDLRWRFRPAALFRGQLGLGVSVNPAGGFLETEIGLSPGGSVNFSRLQGGVSIGALQSLLPMPGIEGNLRLDFDRLVLRDGFPASADGSIEVMSLIARGLSPNPMGDFRVVLTTGDDAITGSLEDLGGALDVAGSLRLGRDRAYLISGLVAPTAQTPTAVVNQLQFLGSANERGQRPFRFEGTL
jgi:general secretion pathway protein N